MKAAPTRAEVLLCTSLSSAVEFDEEGELALLEGGLAGPTVL